MTKLGYLLPGALLTIAGLAMYPLPGQGEQFGTWLDLFGYGAASLLIIGIAIIVGARAPKMGQLSSVGKMPGFARQLAVGSLFAAGFLVLGLGTFYPIIRSGNTGTFTSSSFQSIANAVTLAGQPVEGLYHLDYHFAVSSSLAVGFAVALIYLAAGPVRRGEAWGWKMALVIGLVPSIGIVAVSAAVFAGVEPINHIHASTLAFVLFWLSGTGLAFLGRRENVVADEASESGNRDENGCGPENEKRGMAISLKEGVEPY